MMMEINLPILIQKSLEINLEKDLDLKTDSATMMVIERETMTR